MEKIKALESKSRSAPPEPREKDNLVLITQDSKTISGRLLQRTSHSLQVLTSGPDLKIGRRADLVICTGRIRNPQKGLIKRFTERVDRRRKSGLFYIFDITLKGF